MPLILTQTNTAAACGAVAGCSGLAAADTNSSREATSGGTAGGTEVSLSISNPNTNILYALNFQTADNEPGDTSWESGNYVVRINVTTANTDITWEDTYICIFDNACGSLATVGSLTGQGISCGTTGVKTMTISGTAQTANLSDELYIVCGFKSAGAHGTDGWGITPDQNIDTPIDTAVTLLGAAALTATGTIGATATNENLAVVSLSSTGTIGAIATNESLASVALNATGTIGAIAAVEHPGVVSLSSLATIGATATVVGTKLGVVSLNSTLTIDPVSTVDHTGIASLNSTLTIVATATNENLAQASLNSIATVGPTGTVIVAEVGQTIDGSSSKTISTKYGEYFLYSNNDSNYFDL